MKRNPIQQRTIDRKHRRKMVTMRSNRVMKLIYSIPPEESPFFQMFGACLEVMERWGKKLLP